MLIPAEIIRRKREGNHLASEEIAFLVNGLLDGRVSEGQMGAFLMAVLWRGMSSRETADLCRSMVESGDVLDLSSYSYLVDKHSTGGVGDKISIPLAPLVASCGGIVPMMSGRGLGHTGGTLDKLASIPGFRADLSGPELRSVLDRVGCVMIAPSSRIAPADKRIYALRDVTSTVESIPLIAASIMSKKLAEGTRSLLMDVKVGRGAFMKTEEEARSLARTLVEIGRANGCRTKALLTRMEGPLGRTVGNSLEIIESIEILKGRGPSDTTELTLRFAAEMLLLSGVANDPDSARALVEKSLLSGAGLERFRLLIEAQGGDPSVIEHPEKILPAAKNISELESEGEGILQSVDSFEVGMCAVLLGAGRFGSEDSIDPAVGFEILKRPGDSIQSGEALARIHWNDEARYQAARSRLASAFVIGPRPVQSESSLIIGEVE